MRLSLAERESFRKRILIFLGKNSSWKQSQVVKHFSLEGYARSTIYETLNKIARPQPIKDKKEPDDHHRGMVLAGQDWSASPTTEQGSVSAVLHENSRYIKLLLVDSWPKWASTIGNEKKLRNTQRNRKKRRKIWAVYSTTTCETQTAQSLSMTKNISLLRATTCLQMPATTLTTKIRVQSVFVLQDNKSMPLKSWSGSRFPSEESHKFCVDPKSHQPLIPTSIFRNAWTNDYSPFYIDTMATSTTYFSPI